MHWAELYEVEPRVLVQAVKRNIENLSEDFMFQLNPEEFANLKSQIVISSWGGVRRTAPYAFTEQGVSRKNWGLTPICLAKLFVLFVSLIGLGTWSGNAL